MIKITEMRIVVEIIHGITIIYHRTLFKPREVRVYWPLICDPNFMEMGEIAFIFKVANRPA